MDLTVPPHPSQPPNCILPSPPPSTLHPSPKWMLTPLPPPTAKRLPSNSKRHQPHLVLLLHHRPLPIRHGRRRQPALLRPQHPRRLQVQRSRHHHQRGLRLRRRRRRRARRHLAVGEQQRARELEHAGELGQQQEQQQQQQCEFCHYGRDGRDDCGERGGF
jgi:hypothetical protein